MYFYKILEVGTGDMDEQASSVDRSHPTCAFCRNCKQIFLLKEWSACKIIGQLG